MAGMIYIQGKRIKRTHTSFRNFFDCKEKKYSESPALNKGFLEILDKFCP